jgi:hypothetical protein
MCACHGSLSREIIKPGAARDGYWTSVEMKAQLQKAIEKFTLLHPGSVGVFLFDQSSNHNAFAADALRATNMGKRIGGKQSKLRDGWYTSADGTRIVQPMVFPSDHEDEEKRGKAKGMEVVLTERGLWRDGLLKTCSSKKSKALLCSESNTCCATALLQAQPDFKEQKSALEMLVTEAGHIFLSYPKYHCELNWIERVWDHN